MILGPVSYFDCVVFCILLAPQLIWQAGLFETISCTLRALPFLGEQPGESRVLIGLDLTLSLGN